MSTKKTATLLDFSNYTLQEIDNLYKAISKERLKREGDIKKKLAAKISNKEIKAWKKKISALKVILKVSIPQEIEVVYYEGYLGVEQYDSLNLSIKTLPVVKETKKRLKKEGDQIIKDLKKLAKTHKVNYFDIIDFLDVNL